MTFTRPGGVIHILVHDEYVPSIREGIEGLSRHLRIRETERGLLVRIDTLTVLGAHDLEDRIFALGNGSGMKIERSKRQNWSYMAAERARKIRQKIDASDASCLPAEDYNKKLQEVLAGEGIPEDTFPQKDY